ncbi:MAG TPA: hypothetical protein PLR20_02060 [Syntrophales bacterium]|nr:hypothetical protein [Syntrophales bacterium]HOX94474.1 hypothetical protein [Syntrophales bacterium]HPI58533.1 hypothetical protein [Syntrophales bacterium]HPN25627.1 hypothetical protein [Syntrophales bacterium]HQM28115.1 hypothetical protein [Syntrophales bacterium]
MKINKKSKVGLWTLASLAAVGAGTATFFLIGPRKIKEKVSGLRGKSKKGSDNIEADGP